MKRYTYKNIVCFQDYGRWHADYMKDGKRFAIHRSATRTKAEAYAQAKDTVDYLNGRS